MRFLLTPRYEDLIDDLRIDLEDLLPTIPTKALLITIAAISERLDLGEPQQLTVQFFFRRNFEKLDEVIPKIRNYYRKQPGPVHIFSKLYLNRLAIAALSNANSNQEDTTPEEEWLIFKAYMTVVTLYQIEQEEVMTQRYSVEVDSFNRLSWIIISEQYQFNFAQTSYFDIIRSLTLLDELIKRGFTEELKNYSKEIKSPIADFISNIDGIVNHKYQLEFNGWKTPSFFITINPEYSHLFDDLCLDISKISSESRFNENYLALKKYPLLKHVEGTYIVLNRDFLRNKIYNGFLFDFYNRSGIRQTYRNFADFKSFLGKEVSEGRLFKGLIQSIYSKKHHVVIFSEEDGHPDCYLRINNRIFLIEFKDYMMSSRTVMSFSAEEFQNELDLKFVLNQRGNPKGISQLANQINFLEKDEYEFDKLSMKKIQKRKLEIYPIIVFTDQQYTIPGINSYLISRFKDLGSEAGIFKAVIPPTMISMNFLLTYIQHIEKNRLDKIIMSYHKRIEIKKKELSKNPTPQMWGVTNLSIDHLGVEIDKDKKSKEHLVKKYFDILDLSDLKACSS